MNEKPVYPALDFLKNYWFILVFITGLIVAWTGIQGEIARMKVDVSANQTAVSDIEKKQGEILLSLQTLNQALLGIDGNGGMAKDLERVQLDVNSIKLDLAGDNKDGK